MSRNCPTKLFLDIRKLLAYFHILIFPDLHVEKVIYEMTNAMKTLTQSGKQES